MNVEPAQPISMEPNRLDERQTNRLTPHPGPLPVEGRGSNEATLNCKAPRLRRFLLRLLSLLLLATCIGWVLNRTGHLITKRGGVAGFGVGIVQGTLMPLALPNLVIGDDV